MKLPPMDSPEFLELPALAPPPGVTSNFKDPKNLSNPELAAIQLVVATIAVFARLYTKKFVLKRMLSEDWFLLAAWVAFCGFHGIVFPLEYIPLGAHQWDITIRTGIRQAKYFLISTVLYSVVVIPLRLAIILQIRRIVLPKDTGVQFRARFVYRWIIDGFIFINVAFYSAMLFFQFGYCRPMRKAWDFRVPGVCIEDQLIVHIICAAVSVASDLCTVALPQPVIWGLKMRSRRKWGLSAVFAIGGLASVVSTIRLYYAIRLYHTTDHTYLAGLMGKWVEPELTLGFLAVTLPVAPTFFRYLPHTAAGLRVRKLWTHSPPSAFTTGNAAPGSDPGMTGSHTYVSHGSDGVRSGAYAVGKGSFASTVTAGSHLSSGGRGMHPKGCISKMDEVDIEFAELTRSDDEDEKSVGRVSGEGRSGTAGGHGRAGAKGEEWVTNALAMPRPVKAKGYV